ncbi:MAG: PilX N-terminal domain-containing pilus assembly protein [Bacillota bacterium]
MTGHQRGDRRPRGRCAREESGAVLVLALLVTLLVVSLGLGILAAATGQVRQAANQRDAALALNAAEAGLNLALDVLASGDDLPKAGLGPSSLHPGVTYQVTVRSETNGRKQRTLVLAAEGVAGRAHRTVLAGVMMDSKGRNVTLEFWREDY